MSKASLQRLRLYHGSKLLVAFMILVLVAQLSQLQAAQATIGQGTVLFPVCRNGRCGYIDRHGRLAVGLRFDEARNFTEGLAPVRLGVEWGYVDEKGQIVIAVQFANAGEFSGGLAPVERGFRWGYIDKVGRFVVEPRFDEARPFSFGFAQVRLGTDWFYIDWAGHRSSRDFWGAPNFSEELTPAASEGKVGYVDSQLNWAIKPQFIEAGRFSEGVAPVQVGGKWGYIDRSRSLVILPRFVKAESFSEGLAAVAVDINREGYIDKSGRFAIPPKFGEANAFSEGLAPVIYRGHLVRGAKEHTGLKFVGARWGYIDKSGKLVIRLDQRTDYAGPFTNAIGYVRFKGGSYGYIDTRGRYLWRPSK